MLVPACAEPSSAVRLSTVTARVTVRDSVRWPAVNSPDETGLAVTLQTIANSRATLGMFGSGYIEMLARQMTIIFGLSALGNGYLGVHLRRGSNLNRIGTDGNGVCDEEERNVISGNGGNGLQLAGAGTEPPQFAHGAHTPFFFLASSLTSL